MAPAAPRCCSGCPQVATRCSMRLVDRSTSGPRRREPVRGDHRPQQPQLTRSTTGHAVAHPDRAPGRTRYCTCRTGTTAASGVGADPRSACPVVGSQRITVPRASGEDRHGSVATGPCKTDSKRRSCTSDPFRTAGPESHAMGLLLLAGRSRQPAEQIRPRQLSPPLRVVPILPLLYMVSAHDHPRNRPARARSAAQDFDLVHLGHHPACHRRRALPARLHG